MYTCVSLLIAIALATGYRQAFKRIPVLSPANPDDKRDAYNADRLKNRLTLFVWASTIPASLLIILPSTHWQNPFAMEQFPPGPSLVALAFVLPAFKVFLERFSEKDEPLYSLFCDHCHKHIDGEVGWKCGRCSEENLCNGRESFFALCVKCKDSPTGIICPSCNRTVFFDSSQSSRNIVVTANAPKNTIQRWLEIIGELATIFDKEIKQKEMVDEIEFATKLEEHLSRLFEARKRRRDAEGHRSRQEPNEADDGKSEDLHRKIREALEVDQIVADALREGKERLKDNSRLWKLYREVVERWREDNLN